MNFQRSIANIFKYKYFCEFFNCTLHKWTQTIRSGCATIVSTNTAESSFLCNYFSLKIAWDIGVENKWTFSPWKARRRGLFWSQICNLARFCITVLIIEIFEYNNTTYFILCTWIFILGRAEDHCTICAFLTPFADRPVSNLHWVHANCSIMKQVEEVRKHDFISVVLVVSNNVVNSVEMI